MKGILVGVVFAAACTVGSTKGGPTPSGPTEPDAAMPANPGSNSDNNGSNTGSNGSNSNLPTCTGALYDPCTDNTQCMSQNCKLFGGAGLEVCTVTCTPGDNTPCGAGTCNNMGICKPNAANACSR
jgi:hypothetical protein